MFLFLIMTSNYTSSLVSDTKLNIKRIPNYKIAKNDELKVTLVKSSPIVAPPGDHCGVCRRAVEWSCTVGAIACDECDVWYHTDCMGMSRETYDRLNNTNINWICKNCNRLNFSSLQLDSSPSESENSFELLASLSDITDVSGVDSPLQQRSRRKNAKKASTEYASRSLRVLSVNLGSVNAKRESFWEAVDSSDPDVIIACETWLKEDILSSEIMPPGFNPPLRKDRADGYGGVLLATKTGIIANEIKIETKCEILATKLDIIKEQPLIIVSVYRPTNNDLPYAERLCEDLCKIAAEYPSATLWISGDFNLPDIDWQTESIVGHNYSVAINNQFISTFNDLGLTQVVTFPTRQLNTLDLFLTNRPALVSKCVPLPGVSDHEMVLTISNIKARHHKPAPRKILLWKKTNPIMIKKRHRSVRIFLPPK